MIDSFSGPYRFLSNFYLCEVILDGEKYPSIEHAFQAAKTLGSRESIKQAINPAQAKKRGRMLQLRSDWEQIKIREMRNLLQQKFSIPILKEALLATKDHELVEGNTWGDTFWGICNNTGQNNLGKLLMEIREEIKND